MPENRLSRDLDEVLALNHDVWDQMRGQRVFVTGGTGFIGTWLMESFAWANRHLSLDASAVVLTRDAEAFSLKAPHLVADNAITLWEGDVRTFTPPPGDFAFIIHAATDASVALNRDEPLRMLDTIVGGTKQVLEMARHCNVRRLLLTSSGAVYGPQPHDLQRTPEEYRGAPDPTDLMSAYGEGKRVSELLCRLHAARDGFDVAIARCFAFIGPHLPLDGYFAAGNFVRDRLSGSDISIGGDGTPRRSYLYASDLAAWLWRMLFNAPSGRPYNVGSGVDISIEELAMVVANSGSTSPSGVRVAKHAIPNSPVQRYVPSVERIVTELGVREMVSLDEAIERTLRWHSPAVA